VGDQAPASIGVPESAPESGLEPPESTAIDESSADPESIDPLPESTLPVPESTAGPPESTVVIEVSAPDPESTGVDVSTAPESRPLVESGAPPLSFSGLVPPELLLEQACVASTMAALAAPTIAVFFQIFIRDLGE
jgi:hypothetical protein